MRALVPFDARDPKTRLDAVLDADERAAFAAAMCRDTLTGLANAGLEPELLATAEPERLFDVPVRIDDRALTPAVNDALSRTDGDLAVVVADLPLATPESVARLIESDGDVVLAPGLGGGTNAIVIRHPEFRVDYHEGSYRKHCDIAADVGATATTVDSFRLAIDVDEPRDLAEVLLHGAGEAREWLREAGFELASGGRGVRASRDHS